MEKKWFEEVKRHSGVNGSWCEAPYDNIFIGSSPLDGVKSKKWANQFDAIVNVSCTEEALFEPSKQSQRTYWYPVNECGEWSYGFFVWAFKILDFHFEKGHKIYVHCHAGVYRSPSIVKWWLFYKGHGLEDSANIVDKTKMENRKDDLRMTHYSLFQNYILGNLPPNFQDFILRLRNLKVRECSYTYTASLYDPKEVSKRPEVRTSVILDRKFWMNIKKPFYKIKRSFQYFVKYIQLRRNKMKTFYTSKGYSIDMGDFERMAKDRKKL